MAFGWFCGSWLIFLLAVFLRGRVVPSTSSIDNPYPQGNPVLAGRARRGFAFAQVNGGDGSR